MLRYRESRVRWNLCGSPRDKDWKRKWRGQGVSEHTSQAAGGTGEDRKLPVSFYRVTESIEDTVAVAGQGEGVNIGDTFFSVDTDYKINGIENLYSFT